MNEAFPKALSRLHAVVEDKILPNIDAQPEEQLKPVVLRLIVEAGATLKREVEAKAEAQLSLLEIQGRPDLGVAINKALCGYVELKAPGLGAQTERFQGHSRTQWDKFKLLPNILYTDGVEWALYRTGQRQGDLVRLERAKHGATDGFDDEAAEALLNLLRDFLIWEPIVPATPKALAIVLAPLCRLLRDEVLARLSDRNSRLLQLKVEWGRYLFRNQSDEQFADAYAQTVTYALLLARLEGATNLRARTAWDRLSSGHELLAEALRGLADPNACDEISLPIELLERSINQVDPKALMRRSKDPWLYFYEHFLSEYDPKLRKDRGVYFTPHEVVQAQINLVSELLAGKFRKRFAFADDDVLFLDPGVGTGAYPVAAIEHSLNLVRKSRGAGSVPARATVAANNLHAFEILVGPYTVAHLRTTQAIKSAKGRLPEDGMKVFLTDTLESPFAQTPRQTPLVYETLNTEHLRASNVKAIARILVCLGNPPYDRHSSAKEGEVQKGGWVRHGDPHHGYRAILDDFANPAKEAGYGVHLKNLYNDYVYFWRWALWKVFENSLGPGIVSFITAASYLRGPGFAGMRKVMRETFDELWIIDLGGDNRGTRRSDNVFAIETPVAIAVGVRYGAPTKDSRAKVHYTRIDGDQDEKLARLTNVSGFEALKWKDTLTGPLDPFVPKGRGQFFGWPLLTDVFPWQHPGIEAQRAWPIGQSRDLLETRWHKLASAASDEKQSLFREGRDRKITLEYPASGIAGQTGRLASIESTTIRTPAPPIERFGFRTLDRQWILADSRLATYLRPPLWHTLGKHQVFITSMLTGVLGEGPAATATAYVPDRHHFRGSYSGKDIIPLWRDSDCKEPNVTAGLLSALRGLSRVKIGADELLSYCYAILGGPSYARRFWQELSEPGPRIPFTKDPAVFHKAVRLGRRLIWLHTYGERMRPHDATLLPEGEARCTKAVPESRDEYPVDFDYDVAKRVLRVGAGEFHPVSEAVWGYSVSGLEVVRSWLRYRMKNGAGKKSSPLDDIRPERWTHELTEELLQLLWVLEATVEMWPQLEELLAAVLQTDIVVADELPRPSENERKPPDGADEQTELLE